MAERLGLIAGRGSFPLVLAASARRQGLEVVAVAIKGEADPTIEQAAHRVHWLNLTQLGKMIQIFQREGVTRAVMAGQVVKRRMYLTDLLTLDATAARLWRSLPDKRGDTILTAVADELARQGIHLEDSTLHMAPFLARGGVMTKGKPTQDELADVEFGLRMAKAVAEEDIGQSVCVKDRSVVAVEAVEGTDECIRRAGTLCGPGFVLVKVSKRNHDMRFDVPVTGLTTVATMAEAGGRVLAVEAGRTLMLDREALLGEADRRKVVVMGIAGHPAAGEEVR